MRNNMHAHTCGYSLFLNKMMSVNGSKKKKKKHTRMLKGRHGEYRNSILSAGTTSQGDLAFALRN